MLANLRVIDFVAFRLLTLAGLRRRGVAPESINAFCREIGITRNANVIPYHKLEHHVRTHLDATSDRVLMVLRPLKVRQLSDRTITPRLVQCICLCFKLCGVKSVRPHQLLNSRI